MTYFLIGHLREKCIHSCHSQQNQDMLCDTGITLKCYSVSVILGNGCGSSFLF